MAWSDWPDPHILRQNLHHWQQTARCDEATGTRTLLSYLTLTFSILRPKSTPHECTKRVIMCIKFADRRFIVRWLVLLYLLAVRVCLSLVCVVYFDIYVSSAHVAFEFRRTDTRRLRQCTQLLSQGRIWTLFTACSPTFLSVRTFFI